MMSAENQTIRQRIAQQNEVISTIEAIIAGMEKAKANQVSSAGSAAPGTAPVAPAADDVLGLFEKAITLTGHPELGDHMLKSTLSGPAREWERLQGPVPSSEHRGFMLSNCVQDMKNLLLGEQSDLRTLVKRFESMSADKRPRFEDGHRKRVAQQTEVVASLEAIIAAMEKSISKR
jgi:hypothetical protein